MRGATSFSSVNANCAFGNSTLEYISDNAVQNSGFGSQALKGITSGKYNVGIGSAAGFALSGDSNTVVGTASGYTTTGNGNIVLGAFSNTYGSGTLTGSKNILIGCKINLPNNAASNQLNIQNIIYGINNFSSGSTPSTGNIGIGIVPTTTTSGSIYPSSIAKFDINGTLRIRAVTITTNNSGLYLFVDNEGMVGKASLPPAGVNSYCGVVNRIPVANNSNGSMSCSQIYDNGNSVGIGPAFNTGSANFSYTYPSTPGNWYTGGPGSPSIPASGNIRLAVDGITQSLAFYAFSDERFKKDIKIIKNAVEHIKKLRGVTYKWDKSAQTDKLLNDIPQIGFIAQEIAKVIPEAVIKNEDGFYSVNYSAIIPLLTEGIKEQQTIIEELKFELNEIKSKLNNLTNLESNLTKTKNKDYFIIQPNPIETESKVIYILDNPTGKATFVLYDLQGKMLKQYPVSVSNGGEGQIIINKSNLNRGMYILSLLVNNEEMQSKKLLIL
jgi:hypothetical protein